MALSEFAKTLILATVPAIVGGGVIVGGIEYFSKDRELDIRMVEIGIAILRVDPQEEEQVSPARGWAIRLINHYSPVDLDTKEAAALLSAPLDITLDPIRRDRTSSQAPRFPDRFKAATCPAGWHKIDSGECVSQKLMP